jgi:hypothetical protein
MSKILDATCSAAGTVSSEGVTVPAAEVLSEGNQSSSGLLFIEGEKARYLPSSATDIKTTIEKVCSALTEIANTLTAIGTGMTGATTAPPGTLATSVAAINTKVTELNTLKAALK